MATIPWKLIADVALPHLIEQSGKLFRKADSAASTASEAQEAAQSNEERYQLLLTRVDQLESLEAEQAKLLKQSLEELQKVAVLAARLQARATGAVIVSALALIGCVLAFVLR